MPNLCRPIVDSWAVTEVDAEAGLTMRERTLRYYTEQLVGTW